MEKKDTFHAKVLELCKPLKDGSVQWRIQRTAERNGAVYATVIAYKDARGVINRLNSVFGGNWKDEYEGNMCRLSIYNDDLNEWVGRCDVGTESNMEKIKGLYSDSFKRAATKWGIGVELYDLPEVVIMLGQSDFYKDKRDGKIKTTTQFNRNFKKWKFIIEGSEVISVIDTNNNERKK